MNTVMNILDLWQTELDVGARKALFEMHGQMAVYSLAGGIFAHLVLGLDPATSLPRPAFLTAFMGTILTLSVAALKIRGPVRRVLLGAIWIIAFLVALPAEDPRLMTAALYGNAVLSICICAMTLRREIKSRRDVYLAGSIVSVLIGIVCFSVASFVCGDSTFKDAMWSLLNLFCG